MHCIKPFLFASILFANENRRVGTKKLLSIAQEFFIVFV